VIAHRAHYWGAGVILLLHIRSHAVAHLRYQHGLWHCQQPPILASDGLLKILCQSVHHGCPSRLAASIAFSRVFRGDFHHQVVWRSVTPRLDSVPNAKKSSRPWALRLKRTLDHRLQHRFQPPSLQQTLATGLSHASGGLRLKPCSSNNYTGRYLATGDSLDNNSNIR